MCADCINGTGENVHEMFAAFIHEMCVNVHEICTDFMIELGDIVNDMCADFLDDIGGTYCSSDKISWEGF